MDRRSFVLGLPGLLASSANGFESGDRDRFGGWKRVKAGATGFFRAVKVERAWWLVSPEGNGFFSKGVCNVSFDGDQSPALGYSPYRRAVESKYGSKAIWSSATVKRMRGWGLNTAGAWSSSELSKQGIAYAPILDLAAKLVPDLWRRGAFPDVFDPQFAATVRREADRICRPLRSDPWLLGYFTDNELRWGPDWRSKESLLETFLQWPEYKPGRARAEQFLRERGCEDLTPTPVHTAAFQELAAGEYFRICKAAIRQADPNHLILGCRFAGVAPEPVLRSMKPYVDVVSFNTYEHELPVGALNRVHEMTGRPLMVTEFSFKALDSGLPNSKGGGKPVATQVDRANLYETFVTDLARLPYAVGYHWFEWCDEPKEGRFDGEDCNYGLVKIDDSAWTTLTERFRAVNPRLEAFHLAQ